MLLRYIKYRFQYYNVIMLLLIAGLFVTVLVMDNSLYDPIRISKIFFFINGILILIPFGALIFCKNWKYSQNKISLFILLWIIWIILNGKNDGIFNDEKLFWLLGCFVFFFISSAIFNDVYRRKKEYLFIIPIITIVIVAFIEAIIGILQLFNRFNIYHSIFKVTGTFFNPALYAVFLSASVPWALLILKLIKKAYLKILIWCIIFIISLAISLTQSRSAFLGLFFALINWIYYSYNPLFLRILLNTRMKIFSGFIIILFILFQLFFNFYLYKKDSANGRLLIWKITLKSIKEQPFRGYGFNSAPAILAPAQAYYFDSKKNKVKEETLAQSIQSVFNEPLQITLETGIVGLFIFLLTIGYALFYKISSPISFKNYMNIAAARSSLICILIFGLFSYPFSSLPITLLFFYGLAVVSIYNNKTILHKNLNFIIKIIIITGIIISGIFFWVQQPRLKNGYQVWNKAAKLYRDNAFHEANHFFAEAYPILKYNGLFLQHYGKSLYNNKNVKDAIYIMNKASRYYNDEYSYIILGDCYKHIGEYTIAENFYNKASAVVPSKHYPIYLLAKLYEETGQPEMARKYANIVLTKKVKIQSEAIQTMQLEMRKIIYAK